MHIFGIDSANGSFWKRHWINLSFRNRQLCFSFYWLTDYEKTADDHLSEAKVWWLTLHGKRWKSLEEDCINEGRICAGIYTLHESIF